MSKQPEQFRMLIGGKAVDAISGRTFEKASGMGRENGIDAVHAYTESKSVWVELSGDTRDPFTLG